MPDPQPDRNPMALTALLVSLVPLFTSLSMVGLKYGVGPKALLYWFAQVGGFFLFGLIVIGSALAVVALSRAGGRRDLRIHASLVSLALSVLLIALFAR